MDVKAGFGFMNRGGSAHLKRRERRKAALERLLKTVRRDPRRSGDTVESGVPAPASQVRAPSVRRLHGVSLGCPLATSSMTSGRGCTKSVVSSFAKAAGRIPSRLSVSAFSLPRASPVSQTRVVPSSTRWSGPTELSNANAHSHACSFNFQKPVGRRWLLRAARDPSRPDPSQITGGRRELNRARASRLEQTPQPDDWVRRRSRARTTPSELATSL